VPELEELDVPIEALAAAPEAFLTSTSRNVHPIRRVGDSELAGAPGPLTQHAFEVWKRNAASDIDP